MAVLLAGTGLFLYLQLRADLGHTLDQGLRSRAGDVSALVAQADTGLKDAAHSRTGGVGSGFAQILDGRGRVFDATAGLGQRPVLTAAQLRQGSRHQTTFARIKTPALEGPSRVLATPVNAQGRHLVVVVGASLETRDRALANLGTLLLLGGPVALLLASIAGYGVATAALRPVESMRARAAAISSDDLDQRLPLSRSRDELHRLGRTLNEMLARLESGVARERNFVADASHELRTPLSMLKTELELIARDHPAGSELDAAIASAVAETDRLAALTEDLLVLARSDRGRLPLRRESISVLDVLAGVATRYTPSNGRLVTFSAPEPVDLRLDADRARVEQALTNLVDNALRHGEGQVRLSARPRDGFVELHVTDRGHGFQPEFLPNAFERFARGDPGRTEDGTGLGLAIVSAIAEGHGGGAHAANRADGGADVWMELPRKSAGS
jgi:signal transduction histidine kinase